MIVIPESRIVGKLKHVHQTREFAYGFGATFSPKSRPADAQHTQFCSLPPKRLFKQSF
jgi:hypothetical protein